MGEAKRRGTYEERKAAAIARENKTYARKQAQAQRKPVHYLPPAIMLANAYGLGSLPGVAKLHKAVEAQN